MIAGVYTDIYSDPALAVLEKAALATAYQWKDWISESDLYQEAWEWRLRHPVRVSAFMDKEEPDVSGLERVVKSYLTSVARREKALACGYRPDDEVFYTPAVIAELLPLTLDIEAALLPAAATDEDSVMGTGNPHGQSDFVTSLLDVREAWISTTFRGNEYRLLEARFIDDMDYQHIAASFEMEVDDVKSAVARGLGRMANYLGGWPGRDCEAGCECKGNE